MLWNYGLHWYPFILITPFLCALTSWVVSRIEEKKTLSHVFHPALSLVKILGTCSFEIYLIHQFLFRAEHYMLTERHMAHSNLVSVGLAILSIVIAIVYHWIVQTVIVPRIGQSKKKD